MKSINLQNIVWKEGKDYIAWNLNTGVSSFGDTRDEALAALQEALELYFEDVPFSQAVKVERPDIVTQAFEYAPAGWPEDRRARIARTRIFLCFAERFSCEIQEDGSTDKNGDRKDEQEADSARHLSVNSAPERIVRIWLFCERGNMKKKLELPKFKNEDEEKDFCDTFEEHVAAKERYLR